MCYSILYFTPSKGNDSSFVLYSRNPEGPLGSYLYDVTFRLNDHVSVSFLWFWMSTKNFLSGERNFILFLFSRLTNPFLSCVPFTFLPLNTLFMWNYRFLISCFSHRLISHHEFSQLLMHYSRGDCGHMKAWWDNYHSCLSCSSCSRNSTCYICSQWSDDVWILAEKRRTLATRRSIMTKKRDNKTKKRNVSDPSDTISIDRSTAPHSFTARGRIHLGGSPMETTSNRTISPPGTRHQSTSHLSSRQIK